MKNILSGFLLGVSLMMIQDCSVSKTVPEKRVQSEWDDKNI